MVYLLKQMFQDDQDKQRELLSRLKENERDGLETIKNEYIQLYSKNPSFPEHIIARGLQVFSTTVCNRQKENDIIKYGDY